ncbi:hypothetical protein AQUCO_03400013v1 [Aquilegia coerulea]|uniref:BHLH domain-containing protein n=1 Tax=Aquilegia coerulea TaxID=218851 RepID=A0A2G5CX29_AQUCA|nr:hypothetical protein AQUCO_03400013v1 [Aquilegia coerulea]
MEKEFFGNANATSPSPHLSYRPSISISSPQDMEIQANDRLPNCFLNLNWENSMDHGVHFDSALSSFVSSPAASNSRGASESVVIRELIGRLGSICNSNDISTQQSQTLNYMGEGNNSTNTSCYSTPLNSPPKLNNLSMLDHQLPMPNHPGLAPFSTDPGFAERAARYSCFGTKSLGGLMGQFGFNDLEMPQRSTRLVENGKLSRVSSSHSLKATGSLMNAQEQERLEEQMRSIPASVSDRRFTNKLSRSSSPDNAEFNNAAFEKPLASESIQIEEANMKSVNDVNARKRKTAPKSKAKDITSLSSSSKDAKEATDDDKSNGKRSKSNDTNGNEKASAKAKGEPNSGDGAKKQNKDTPKPSPEPPKDYIHVRARRGQATDSHSLAERVRREKISERMKFLQDLVPGCNKVTGKALMLDEIINYVQSLQRQVEFLSMKLATVNPRLDFNMEATLTKDLLQSRESLSQAMYQLNSSVSAFHYGHQGEGTPVQREISNRTETQSSMNPLGPTLQRNTSLELPPLDGFGEAAAHFANFWEDDLQSVVQMGFNQNQSQESGFEIHSFQGKSPRLTC